jgi:FO synthase
VARLILDAEVSLQAPPNLNPRRTSLLLGAGIDDFGGISPLTPDYVNPRHPWPHLDRLWQACAERGFELAPRAAVHAGWVERGGWLDERMRAPVETTLARLRAVRHPGDLARRPGRSVQVGGACSP